MKTYWKRTFVSMNRASKHKQLDRKQLDADVKKFLANGGQVQKVEFGVMKGPVF